MLLTRPAAHVKTNARPHKKDLSRLAALTKELIVDIEYASHARCRCLWTAYQCRRSDQSIEKKKAECRRLLADIGSKTLALVTEQLWKSLDHEWPLDRANPSIPFIARQKNLIANLRNGVTDEARTYH
jgi:hypothetical protein